MSSHASSSTQDRPLTPPLFAPNRFKGKLIIVEGIDGSGKSTQLALLSQWLRSQSIAVAFSEWNSSPLVHETMRRGKIKTYLDKGVNT
jgi:energy-coupling factor transporter ATP-binding protein EcfA2